MAYFPLIFHQKDMGGILLGTGLSNNFLSKVCGLFEMVREATGKSYVSPRYSQRRGLDDSGFLLTEQKATCQYEILVPAAIFSPSHSAFQSISSASHQLF